MKARPLKELPGFDQAFADAFDFSTKSNRDAMLLIGDAVIPGVDRITSGHWLESLASAISFEARHARRRIRLVPPPRPVAANDCEAP